VEKLGASRLRFELVEVAGSLEMRLKAMHFWGIPCPQCLMPDITARETGEAQRLHFHVQASVPFIGQVVSYRGYLMVPEHPGEAR
jgi:hypothetical protein